MTEVNELEAVRTRVGPSRAGRNGCCDNFKTIPPASSLRLGSIVYCCKCGAAYTACKRELPYSNLRGEAYIEYYWKRRHSID